MYFVVHLFSFESYLFMTFEYGDFYLKLGALSIFVFK